MNLWPDIRLVKECCGRQWSELHLQTNSFHYQRKRLAQSALIFSFCFYNSAVAQISTVEAAEEAFAKSSFESALEKYNVILKNPFASSRDLALARCRVGVIQSIQNNFKESRQSLELAVSSNLIPKNISSMCNYALLQIYVLENSNVEARELIKKMAEPTFSLAYVARTWALASEVGKRLQDNKFEVIYLQKLLAVMEKAHLEKVELRIIENRTITLAEVRARLGVESLELNLSSNSVPHPRQKLINLKRVENVRAQNEAVRVQLEPDSAVQGGIGIDFLSKMARGDAVQALALFKSLTSLNAQNDLLKSYGIGIPAESILSRLESLAQDNPRQMRIGIILPAGIPLTRFKHRILKAISAYINSSATKNVSYSFVVRGIRADVGASEDAALSLILNEHVHVLIGPISSAQALGASETASMFGVPVFALGPIAFASEFDSSILTRMGVFAKSQALTHINHIKDQLKFKTAAVFAPDDAYGFEMARAFAEAAAEKNIEVTKTTFFNVSTEVFQESVIDALGPQGGENRKQEFRSASLEIQKKAAAEKRKFDPSEVKLPIQISFDALFIPDALSKVKIIASTFAFNGAKNLHYLGDKFWAEGAGRASLADQFLDGSRIPTLAPGGFLSHLQRELGVKDGLLDLERQSFDALVFIRQAQYLAAGNNGEKMLQSMHSPTWSAEGTSIYSGGIDKYGEPSVKMTLSGYKGGKFTSQLDTWTINEKPEK